MWTLEGGNNDTNINILRYHGIPQKVHWIPHEGCNEFSFQVGLECH